MNIREMTIKDFIKVQELWQKTEGIGLSSADSSEHIHSFLVRNPKGSFVAEENKRIIGAVLSGHDCRRGFIYHLAVENSRRREGIARKLIDLCIVRFMEVGIQKCHIMVFTDNHNGQQFWQHMGWEKRDDILVMSRPV